MTDEKPASEEMRNLAAALINAGQTLLAWAETEPAPALTQALKQIQSVFGDRTEALYVRMQREEQERAEMRGLLEQFAAMEMPADEWGRHCPFWGWNVPDFDDTPNHKPDCPIAQTSALLADGKEGSDDR